MAHLSEGRYFVFLGLAFTLLGYLATRYYTQHEARFDRHQYSTAEISRTRALTQRLHIAEFDSAQLAAQMTEHTLRQNAYYNDAAFAKTRQLSRFLGTLPQEGPGVEITLADSAKPLLVGDNPNAGIVHNTDLAQVINELRAAGAMAVAVNAQPVTAMTGIHCAGPIITINGTRIASPFHVAALGNPRRLEAAMNRPDGFLKDLKQYDIRVTVARKTVSIPAASVDAGAG